MTTATAPRLVDQLFPGGGDAGALIRSIDWSRTAVGPVEQWPPALRTTVSIVLGATTPVFVFWGPEHTQFYNDAYRPILGTDKHPMAMGSPGRATWGEIWHIVGPQIQRTYEGGTWRVDDGQLFMERNGFVEEAFFDWSYSPIRDEHGAVVALYNTCRETTPRVLGNRRLALVRELSLHTSLDTSVDGVFRTAQTLLGAAAADVPFALVYGVDDSGSADLVSCAGLACDGPAAPAHIARGSDPWGVLDVGDEGSVRVDDVGARFGDVIGSAWPEPVRQALVLPLPGAARRHVLVLGMSPRLVADDEYRGFLQLLGRTLAASLAVTHALEQEQQRTAALAALDREKTAFFSNISHEFRTPLTLLLAPTEDALADDALSSGQRERFELVHRNARRLQKLVNALLDVARVDAGRATASYVATEIGARTAEIASGFRSAIDRAGLTLDVEVRGEHVAFVDHDLWEKIVLNLLSNALKFTFDGGIRVVVDGDAEHVRVVVADSGVGIPAAELPRLFQRFHRVAGARSRTGEGSGIGLALVHDLVQLHGGSIDVSSVVDGGTRFSITLPVGSAHLDPAQVATSNTSSTSNLEAFVTEALGWMGVRPRNDDTERAVAVSDARVLVADDNADMREFLRRLLAEHWHVDVVADGTAALDAIRATRYDLVLSDVMMPGLDGFGLLAAVRADAAIADTPIVLVSARAGEDARTEAVEAGADDYLVKPFVARELVARVRARLDVARLRRAVASDRAFLRELFANAPAAINVFSGPQHVFELANAPSRAQLGERRLIGVPIREALPEVDGQGWFEALDDVYASGETRQYSAARVVIGHPEARELFLDIVQQPRRNADGDVDGIVVFAFDVTERVRAAKQLEHEARSKDDFLAMLGHELRNPLAPVVSALHLARHQPGLSPAVGRQLDVIERQTENLTRIVDDLLDVSRISRGRITLQKSDIDLATVIRSAVDAVASSIATREQTLTMTLPTTTLPVHGDPVRLEQVIVNLLTNASKYSDVGGRIGVTVRVEDDVIHAAEARSSSVTIVVDDNGIGIAGATLPHVFELFHQAERSLDRAQGGLGIGLTIVKQLVEMHGGHVGVTSRGPGKGSTFTVTLPLQAPPAVVRAPAPAPNASRALSVLVVDDNVDAAKALAELLDLWEHEAATAFDGTSALRLAGERAFDVIVLDIGLPDVDGYEVARQLRALHRSIRLVALTGYGQPADKARAFEAGFDEHLVKPVVPKALEAVLRRATPASG